MLTQVVFSARITGGESVDNLVDFAQEQGLQLIEADLIPTDARLVKLDEFIGRPTVTFEWTREFGNEPAVSAKKR